MAKLPLSSRTSGRRSGGMTGMTSSTIHSGLLVLSLSASTRRRRLVMSLARCLECVVASSSRSSFGRAWAGPELCSRSRTASAPILAVKRSPYCSCAVRYSGFGKELPRLAAACRPHR